MESENLWTDLILTPPVDLSEVYLSFNSFTSLSTNGFDSLYGWIDGWAPGCTVNMRKWRKDWLHMTLIVATWVGVQRGCCTQTYPFRLRWGRGEGGRCHVEPPSDPESMSWCAVTEPWPRPQQQDTCDGERTKSVRVTLLRHTHYFDHSHLADVLVKCLLNSRRHPGLGSKCGPCDTVNW
jgi:hypothetical protein